MRPVLRLGLCWLVSAASAALGCNQAAPVPEAEPQSVRTRAAVLPLQPEPEGASDAKEPQAVASSSVSATPPGPAPKVTAKVEARPELRRLVVSNAIKDKEPVAASVLTTNDPVIAFLELTNSSPAESVVQVTFQHESGKEVGFVALTVPGEKTRWRTWAQTAMIKQAGKWTAIVRGADGTEIGQQGFFINPT